ncbi:MAG: hypothetical protein ACLTSZ_02745 [Lachnospiraceae bacterium]
MRACRKESFPERALKRSVLRPLQQTVQKNHQNKAGTLEYGADCAALVEEAGCADPFSCGKYSAGL